MDIQLQHNTQTICIAQTEVGEYRDAIYTPAGQEIDVKAVTTEFEGRIGRWVDAIKNPPIQPEPTPEEIQAQIDQMTLMVESFEAQKVELASLKRAKLEAIAIAEALALEEKLVDEKPVEEPIGEVRR